MALEVQGQLRLFRVGLGAAFSSEETHDNYNILTDSSDYSQLKDISTPLIENKSYQVTGNLLYIPHCSVFCVKMSNHYIRIKHVY